MKGKRVAKAAALHAFRLPEALVRRVDVYTQKLQAETPWASVTRSDAVRALITKALDAVEAEDKKKA